MVKNVHLYSAAAAKGGWAQMTPADYGRVGAEIRRQLEFVDDAGQVRGLRRFAEEIASGRQPLDGRFLARVDLYAQAGRGTYHATEAREMEMRGYTEVRNVLHPADHCEGCLAETARGWVPLGKLVPIGRRTCRTRDRCSLAYRNAATGEERNP